MISVCGVSRRYDRLLAVSDVSLELPPGRTLGVIGPNGSGKTTLLRMIGTLVKPTAGTVRVGGHDVVHDPRAVRRMLSFMPAEAAAPIDMSIGEYMAYFATACGVPRADRARAIAEALELLDMRGRDGEIVRGLSTGNRQRLLLAKTLLGNPQLLILDEPASGLDPRARVEVRGFLRELAGLGRTIVVSSHILADLDEIATDIAILEQGRLRLAGPLDAIRDRFAGPRRIVVLRVAEPDVAAAHRLLGGHGLVSDLVLADGAFELSCAGDDANPLLAALISQGVRIAEFRERKPDLEQIFMLSTQGVVS